MTLRPGSYNASRPRPRGVIRNDSYPWFVCVHEHASYPEAKQCARDAHEAIKHDDTGEAPLPDGWEVFNRRWHVDI